MLNSAIAANTEKVLQFKKKKKNSSLTKTEIHTFLSKIQLSTTPSPSNAAH